MNQGEWLGSWSGEWFGQVGESDPNAMVGSASFSITTTGTLVNGASVTPAFIVGSASFSFTAVGDLTSGEEQESRRPKGNTLRLRPIRDAYVLVKQVPLKLGSGRATTVAEVNVSSVAVVGNARISLNTYKAKAFGEVSNTTRAGQALLNVRSGLVETAVAAKTEVVGSRVVLHVGVHDIRVEAFTKVRTNKLRIRAGTVDDVWGGINPSDEELALIAISLTQDKKYIIKNTN